MKSAIKKELKLFLPTPSARRATPIIRGLSSARLIFLPTPSARRATSLQLCYNHCYIEFLPTPSARRATQRFKYSRTTCLFLPTPSARRATSMRGYDREDYAISTHALREEGDAGARGALDSYREYFYPRPPRGGRRAPQTGRPPANIISTHALREEGDVSSRPFVWHLYHFYPRPPRGGRPGQRSAGPKG